MSGMRKVRTIATFEFISAVKRPGYLIATFGMPLFVAAYAALVAIPAYIFAQAEMEDAVYGVVDPAGILGLEGDVRSPRAEIPDDVRTALEAMGQQAAVDQALAESQYIFRPFENEAAARAALARGDVEGYFVLPADYLSSGRVDIYSPERVNLSESEARLAFADLLRARLATGRVEPELLARLIKPLAGQQRYSISTTGEVSDGSRTLSLLRLMIPLAFLVLFLMSVLMTSGYLMQGTATEKENKVVDVLLASANPDEILAGKLLGLGAAGLLQIAVWLVMAMATGLGVVPLLLASGIPIPWLAIALAVPLFALSFLFFGSLILGTGSLGSNMREAQQLAMVWSLLAAIPAILLGVLMQDPDGTTAKIFTWLPFSSASVIILRAGLDPETLAWWEIVGPMLVLLASTWFAIKLGARLFRIGLLSTGSRPSLREIWRQARLG